MKVGSTKHSNDHGQTSMTASQPINQKKTHAIRFQSQVGCTSTLLKSTRDQITPPVAVDLRL
jgi:hypothetical protein